MTVEQQIRAAAAMAVFGQGKYPILALSSTNLGELELASQEELAAVERYIREGLAER